MILENYQQFGGRLSDSAALKHLLDYAQVANPATGQPFTEAMCFGLAGGIGAGYSFCPSVIKWGSGSGVSIPGRYRSYATGPVWFQGFFDRLALKTHVTESTSLGKAFKNLHEELAKGQPVVVWTGRPKLPFFGFSKEHVNLWMYTLLVIGLDEAKQTATIADNASTPLHMTFDELAEARNNVCTHKNRTLTFTPAPIKPVTMPDAIRQAVRATVQELEAGQMKTFSLPGFEMWAKCVANDKAKDGWLKIYQGSLLYQALKDVHVSVELADAGGGLSRGFYADFLAEASLLTKNPKLAQAAAKYRVLAAQWSELADAVLPSEVKVFRQAKDLLRKRMEAYFVKGEKGAKASADASAKLKALSDEMHEFPMSPVDTRRHLEELRQWILALHASEVDAARTLGTAL